MFRRSSNFGPGEFVASSKLFGTVVLHLRTTFASKAFSIRLVSEINLEL